MTKKIKKHNQGFTIIELLVVMAIAAIVLAIGVPSFQTIARTSNTAALSNEFLKALAMARNEAIQRGYPVYICTTADATVASPICSSTSSINWEDGWLMMLDEDNDGDFTDQSENPLLVHETIRSNYSLIGQTAVKNLIGFEATGFAKQSGTIVLCNSKVVTFSTDKKYARVIAVNGSGRSRIFKGNSAAVTVTSCTP
ncbi:MAG: GspH/FimT family pseudopilin [Methylococcales bacterium]